MKNMKTRILEKEIVLNEYVISFCAVLILKLLTTIPDDWCWILLRIIILSWSLIQGDN